MDTLTLSKQNTFSHPKYYFDQNVETSLKRDISFYSWCQDSVYICRDSKFNAVVFCVLFSELDAPFITTY